MALSDEQQSVYVWRIHRRGRGGQPFQQGRGTAAEVVAMIAGILDAGHYLNMGLDGIEVRIDPASDQRLVVEPTEPAAARAFRARWKHVALGVA